VNLVEIGKSPNFCSIIGGEFDVDDLNFKKIGEIDVYMAKLVVTKIIT
jgi:hypothetical protein